MTATATTSPKTAARMSIPGGLNQEIVLALVIVILALVVGLINPRFWQSNAVSDILYNSSYIAIAAIGMTMVIISGNIDISVGSLTAVLAYVAGQLAVGAEAGGYPVWLAYVAPLVLGPLVAAVNGFLVAYLGIPAIVVTLGMLSILKGALILWSEGAVIYNLPQSFTLGQQKLLGAPVPVYFMVVLMVIAALWMRYSATGRAIYAVGGNRDAARLSGISERAVLMRVFIINGLMVGIASILVATQRNVVQPNPPLNLELSIITASVIGGVSILGGVGTVVGSTLGAILIHLLPPAMIFVNISAYWQQALLGVLILLTAMVDLFRRRRQSYLGR